MAAVRSASQGDLATASGSYKGGTASSASSSASSSSGVASFSFKKRLSMFFSGSQTHANNNDQGDEVGQDAQGDLGDGSALQRVPHDGGDDVQKRQHETHAHSLPALKREHDQRERHVGGGSRSNNDGDKSPPILQALNDTDEGGKDESSGSSSLLPSSFSSDVLMGGDTQATSPEMRRLEKIRSSPAMLATARRRFKLDDFEMGECIGHGFFSHVHIVTHKRTGDRYALKTIKEVGDTAARVAFMKEVEILVTLRHPNVLRFCAVFVTETSQHLLTEYLEGGTLRKLLKSKEIPLPFSERWRLALELAQGMEYLHANHIMHRDLKSTNCLLTKDNHAVIADLGLAHMIAAGDKLKESAGTAYWMAPEILHGEPYDKAADVFSYGIVLCEILTRLKATPDEIPRVNSFGLDETALRPLCAGAPEKLMQLAFHCCQLAPNDRPLFSQIVKSLRNMSQFDLAMLVEGEYRDRPTSAHEIGMDSDDD